MPPKIRDIFDPLEGETWEQVHQRLRKQDQEKNSSKSEEPEQLSLNLERPTKE